MTAEQERAAVVGFLREAMPRMEGGLRTWLLCMCLAVFRPRRFIMAVYEACAEAIERGEHHGGGE